MATHPPDSGRESRYFNGLIVLASRKHGLDRREAAEQSRREDAATPPIREHVDTCLPAMLHQFGIDLASAQERFGSEMRIARMCCAACTEAGGPSDFCPNASLLDVLGHSPQRQ